VGLIPTNDDLTCVVLGWKTERFHEFRRDVEGNFLGTIATYAPALMERIAAGSRETRFAGTADAPNFYHRPYGPGWALVGDAGFHKDPITAQGIADAFRDAELLAEAIDGGLAGRHDPEEAMAGYEKARNEASLPMYEFTCEMAALEPPPPHMQQLFGALRANQEETNRFFGVIAGTVPVPDFFAPENLDRIMRAA
jgi:2-polyprenyl-6-methoxyphenol hydroxylase-like FAD-dependent oxidoreductase